MENSVVLIDPTDKEYSVCLNPLEPIQGVDPAVIAAELIDAFAKIWGNSWGARMQEIFRNALVALIENDLTLREVPLILNDPAVRRWLLQSVKDELCIEFFEKYERWSEREKRDYTESTLNKLDDFLANPNVRDIFHFPQEQFQHARVDGLRRHAFGEPRPRTTQRGERPSGSLILSKIHMAAFSRSDIDESRAATLQSLYRRVPRFCERELREGFEPVAEIRPVLHARPSGLGATARANSARPSCQTAS